MAEREGFLKRLEERLTRMSGWLAARQRGGEQAGSRDREARLDAVRQELARARRAAGETTNEDLARVRASFDDMKSDYEVPLQHTALRPGELNAFRKHLHTTSRLLYARSDLDNPDWTPAHEEYERSWDELEHTFETEGGTAASH